ncbi:hypothetical protein QUF75_03990 [Desulfococcaceae bacterium HSG7]|nr:hypothetical protein [Desulfococcaceae bacterium HSG7]
MVWRLRQPASCVTSWSSKDENKKRYALPGTPVDSHTCESLLVQNLIHKWRRLKEIRPDIAADWLQNGATENKEAVDFTEYSLRISLTRSQTI